MEVLLRPIFCGMSGDKNELIRSGDPRGEEVDQKYDPFFKGIPLFLGCCNFCSRGDRDVYNALKESWYMLRATWLSHILYLSWLVRYEYFEFL